jgi:membrane-bound lytic murein transglycosylase B
MKLTQAILLALAFCGQAQAATIDAVKAGTVVQLTVTSTAPKEVSPNRRNGRLVASIPAKPAKETHPGMREQARIAAGSDAALEAKYLALIESAKYQQSIIDAISRPAEGKAWKDYRPIFMTEKRISGGVQFWLKHAEALRLAEETYQVPANYIVAIIGVETFYGGNTGSYKVLDALTTLGLYYPPRQAFFAGELRQFLQMTQNPTVEVEASKALGSYAGAMGMGQFIPTSYVKFAADGDGDGKINLWKTDDAIASVARYFNIHGWQYGLPVVSRARISKKATAIADQGVATTSTVKALSKLGYRPQDKFDGKSPASLIILEGTQGKEHYIILNNFYVITRYNRSPLYAMAVHELALEIQQAYLQHNDAN